ncbi:MAG: serine/threonine-protein kinase, partial [Persicimonas sp.]
MSTRWSDKKRRTRSLTELPKHFCGSCTALRAEDDPVCLDCGRERPGEDGWTPTEHAYDPFLGRVLNERYLIDKIEGRGSSSTIYRADSLKVPKRFAVKMVKLRHTDIGGRHQHGEDNPQDGVIDQIRTRLEREVRAVGMLRNPHIVRVYELLELDQNWIALIMDHIDGYTLEQVVEQEGALPADRACGLVRQVANGLCEAHRVGMIHRDIKPANIMVELLPDGRDFAYLLDFGVVHLEGEAKMTQGFLGTPLYASPEQASATKLDARSDIYSLGATFFYILTGHAPFDSDRTLEVLKAHVYDTAPRLSDKCPAANYPAALEDLVASMLAKSADDRPDDLFEVIESLQRILDADTYARRPSAPAQPPSDCADLAAPLGGEDSFGGARHTQLAGDTETRAGQTTSFEDRPRTATGLKHVSPARPLEERPAERRPAQKRIGADQTVIPGGSPVVPETAEHRARLDSSEITSFNDTNPHGFHRPPTNPGTKQACRDIEVRSTVQFLPEQLAETAKGGAPHLDDVEEAAQACG